MSAFSVRLSNVADTNSDHCVEIVLSMLVSSFKFELSKKPIVWNFAGVTFPAASLDTNSPEMNLIVSKA